MYERILVPLDGSELAEAVLPHVKEIAAKFDSQVILLQVIHSVAEIVARTMPAEAMPLAPLGATGVDMVGAQQKAEREAATAYLEKMRAGFVNSLIEIREGPADTAILEAAAEHDCGLVAMSTHGRSGIKRAVFGSVADAVIRGSHHPLLVIRPQD